jgi:hypothetical protein
MTNEIDKDQSTQAQAQAQAQAQPPEAVPSDEEVARRQVEAFRRQKDRFFRESPDSPLLPEDRENFQGLNPTPAYSECRLPPATTRNTRA